MKPSPCKTCGKAEWGHTCVDKAAARQAVTSRLFVETRFARGARRGRAPDRRADPDPVVAVEPGPKTGAGGAAVAVKRAPKGSGFDKATYQREYMRKRRAKQKETIDG